MVVPVKKARLKKLRLIRLLAGMLIAALAAASSDRTAAGDGVRMSAGLRTCGRKFEPGPVVDGRHRQPTPSEFEARMQALSAACQTAVIVCSSSTSCATGDLTMGANPAANSQSH